MNLLHTALGRARQVTEPAQLHSLSWFALEAALKVGAAARVALWVRWADGAGDPRLAVLARPSFGHWAGLYRELGRALALGDSDHPLARAQLKRRPRPAVDAWLAAARRHDTVTSHHLRAADDLATVFDAAVTYRNRVIGHGAGRPEVFLAELGPLLLDAATALVEGDDLLGGLSLEGTLLGDLQLVPMLWVGDGCVGLLDKLGRSAVTYLDYGSGQAFRADTGAAVRALAGERAKAAEASDHPHNLPRERDAFFGRVRDLALLTECLHQGPLATVLGIGGAGKTRFALRAGWELLPAFPGGVWFCDLSESRSAEGIAFAVASALGVPLSKGDPVDQLGHAIAARGRCLVLLDNFEQVARHAGETLGRWLDGTSDACFVVTSREVLGLPGERSLPLAPLQRAEAVDLFHARARSAKPGFVLSPTGRATVETLVDLLDHLPLAIELAAARSRVMSPEKLLERMSQRFRLLTSSGTRRDRHATLLGTLDWSWDLLSHDEQAGLAQLSVFEGGFTLDAAAAVLDLTELWPEDAVQALVDKSLVRVDGPDRFDLLVSVQAYAADKLDALGDRAVVEARHGEHFATHGTHAALDALNRHGGGPRREALAPELENLVAASRRAVARKSGHVATGAALAAWAVLELKGPFTLGTSVLEAARAETTQPADRVRATLALTTALHFLGRMDEADAHLEASLGAARDLGDRRLEGDVLRHLGKHHMMRGHMKEARASFNAALTLHREGGNRGDEGVVLGHLGALHGTQGRLDEARAAFHGALAVAREVGNRLLEGMVLGNLGILYKLQGRFEEALAHSQAALALHREMGNRVGEGVVFGNLGSLFGVQSRFDEARAYYDQALAVNREVGNRRDEGTMLGNLGNLHTWQGRTREARRHYDAALAVHRAVGNRHQESSVLYYLAALHLEQGRLSEAVVALDQGEEIVRELGDELELAKMLCVRARLLHADGEVGAARTALAEADAIARSVGAGPDSWAVRKLAEARAVIGDPL